MTHYTPRHLKRCVYIADRPGQFPVVYRQYDAAGKLLYVGITSATPPKQRYARIPDHTYEILDHETRQPYCNIVTRIRTHKSTPPWFHLVKIVTVERFTDRAAAAIAERRAIEQEKPVYNKQRYNPL